MRDLAMPRGPKSPDFVMGVAIVGVALYASIAPATDVLDVSGTLFAKGQFDEIETEVETKTLSGEWEARVDTKGESDLYVLENRILPGGTFGWHSHPGPSFVIVKTGALTLYDGDGPNCGRQVFEAQSGQSSSFVDHGGHVHLVRNEGDVETVVYVTSLVPRGAERRIDEANPGTPECAGIN